MLFVHNIARMCMLDDDPLKKSTDQLIEKDAAFALMVASQVTELFNEVWSKDKGSSNSI